jgi:phage tail-like protein
MTIYGVPSDRKYHKRFTYTVEIEGIAWAGFQTCSEIRAQIGVVEQHEGGSLIPDKSPGRLTYPNVTLARGATDDEDLFDWFKQVADMDAMVEEPSQKRSIDIVQRDRRGAERRRWTLVNAFPVEYKGGDWDNTADENNMEEVVLAYDYFKLGGNR